MLAYIVNAVYFIIASQHSPNVRVLFQAETNKGNPMRKYLALILIAFLFNISLHALETSDQVKPSSPSTATFHPDPHSVQRCGPAYRYPQAGWIVLHIEGEPYERGVQHGRLLAPEIAAYLRCYSAVLSPTAPAEGWKNTRALVNSLFLRRYDKEYL